MKQCVFCNIEKFEEDFYLYSVFQMTRGRVKKEYVCRECSDKHYGDKWYPITGYDSEYQISNRGQVRELKDNRYFDITKVQNAGKMYAYLSKNGKSMKKNIGPLLEKYCTES